MVHNVWRPSVMGQKPVVTWVYGTNKCGCGVTYRDGKWLYNVATPTDVYMFDDGISEKDAMDKAVAKLAELIRDE